MPTPSGVSSPFPTMSRGEGGEDIPLSGVGLQHRRRLLLLLLHLNGEAGDDDDDDDDDEAGDDDDDDDDDEPHGWLGLRLDVCGLGGVCSSELLRKLLIRIT